MHVLLSAKRRGNGKKNETKIRRGEKRKKKNQEERASKQQTEERETGVN
jgi:hypothetical protein